MDIAQRRRLVLLATLAGGVQPGPSLAALAPGNSPQSAGSPKFFDRLRAALVMLAGIDDPHLHRLHAAISQSAGRVSFREMNDDRATWSNDGDPDRGHTEPVDGRPKREGRDQPADATIFVMMSAVQEGSSRWKSGLLIHELVHALDLSSGRYNRDHKIRERRAVFMQNIWRTRVRYPLRTHYHHGFATLDFQHAEKTGRIADYADYVFARNDFPPVPPQN